MIASINVEEKSFGDQTLYQDLNLDLQAGEKVGLIGRNGTGKTTLFNILTGKDNDFSGSVDLKKNLVVVSSRQEHHDVQDQPVIEYILHDLPRYSELKHIIDTYPETMGDNVGKIHKYSEALEQFSNLDYYRAEEEIAITLRTYGLSQEHIDGLLSKLSGGQKRFVELAKVQQAKADLILIDEPTNHMDYAAKQYFIDWLNNEKAAVLVITHDRDVLAHVNKIIELRDGSSLSFRGNYNDYLRSNTSKITNEVNEYEVTQRRIVKLTDDVKRFRRLKEKARNPGTIARFKSLEQRTAKELARLQQMEKPSFWIDKESVQGLNSKLADSYQEHKARNIRINARTSATKSSRLLIESSKLALSYSQDPLFEPVSFQLREGDRLRLHGKNGAGKTTLVKAILAMAAGEPTEANITGGNLVCEKELTIGNYQQELPPAFMQATLAEAIEVAYKAKNVKVSDQKIRQVLSDFLFNPASDGNKQVAKLSGGQKARLQMINMLANDPMVLILDEPTNHLDLPSIEELEQALAQYHGAIIYISHDSYFTQNIGGTTVKIDL